MTRQMLLQGFRSGGTVAVQKTMPIRRRGRILGFRSGTIIKECLIIDDIIDEQETDGTPDDPVAEEMFLEECIPVATINYAALPRGKKRIK